MYKIIFSARGHPNIKATHKTTLEITKEKDLTPRGTCIIAVNSRIACKDIPENIKKRLREGVHVKLIINVNGKIEEICGYGSKDLILSSPISMVIRKSEYIDDRTLVIKADKSAADIDREIITELKQSKRVYIEIQIG